ncbi:DUF6716 putative glycosyltransferase [Hansschlegelia quercus]|uniref:Polysaccharide pyruvyl transferase domain-containing protein n=1 Tax=Hansschlegelia quercus TaxID=2528245 RepID=A0A4Q9GIE1_9HYPH|nr:DUF6716 putative glycosyltransferase [Hansschlegelia quercus]TBN48615.1 hypothetical protein EYR15_13565 [Hansschlegelia quercus]
MTIKRVAFACDLDSQVFGALPFARRLGARGVDVSFAIDAGRPVPEAVSGAFETQRRSLGALAASQDAFGFDAIGVFATGSRIALFRHTLALTARALRQPRPALFAGFNGFVYERFEEGVNWRLGCDVICLNGLRDSEAFGAIVGGGPFARQPVALTGLRRRWDAQTPTSASREKLFVFAEQVAVPAEPERRRALFQAIAGLASRSPDWEVVIKARVPPKRQTFWNQTAHVASIVAALPRRPKNLTVSYEPLERLLSRAALFGTVSSTALFDALDHRVPSLLATDLGLGAADGSEAMAGSGLGVRLADLASLDAAPRRAPASEWLRDVGYDDAFSPDALLTALDGFDGDFTPPPSLHSFETAAFGAAPSATMANTILAARDETEAALSAGANAAAAQEDLRVAIERSDRQRAIDEAWRTSEGGLAKLARRLKVYRPYKAVRRRLVGETPRE